PRGRATLPTTRSTASSCSSRTHATRTPSTPQQESSALLLLLQLLVLVRHRTERAVFLLDRRRLDERHRIAAGEAVVQRLVELALDVVGRRFLDRPGGPLGLEFLG